MRGAAAGAYSSYSHATSEETQGRLRVLVRRARVHSLTSSPRARVRCARIPAPLLAAGGWTPKRETAEDDARQPPRVERAPAWRTTKTGMRRVATKMTGEADAAKEE